MSAVETASRVVGWAQAGGRGAPPVGGLVDCDGLLRPPGALVEAAGALAAVTAARWQLTAPPFGDGRAPGLGGVWLAAVIGARGAAGGDVLLEHCPAPTGAWDLVLRHVICHAALGHVDETLADALRAHSPLTGALGRPAAGAGDAALALIDRLRAHADGRRLLVRALAGVDEDPAVLRWRAEVLDRLRQAGSEGRAFVYAVYEAALVLHRDETLARSAHAERALVTEEEEAAVVDESTEAQAAGEPDPDAIPSRPAAPRVIEQTLEGALARARWWGPLWALRRSHGDEIKQRPALDVHGLLAGTRLHGLSRQVGGMAA